MYDVNKIKEIHEIRGLSYKADFLESLSEEEFMSGMIKFNIPDEDEVGETNNGEGVWGWIAREDREKYNDDNFKGDIKVILANTPLNFFGIFFWGTELEITCNGKERPVLSFEWVKKNVFQQDWYK